MRVSQSTFSKNWELIWARYDEQTYHAVLAHVGRSDIVLDIGAGDFQFARRMAQKAKYVYAVDIRPELAARALRLPPLENLQIICADAYHWPMPQGATMAVLLMRHCKGFHIILEKLISVGCNRLVTNARWRMGLEVIDLAANPIPFRSFEIGWYACRCGAVGFVEGPPHLLSAEREAIVYEVENCPKCPSFSLDS